MVTTEQIILERCIIFDGGFNVVSDGTATLAAVPEPASALMLGGGALVLLALRGHRNRPAVAPAL